MNRSLIFKALFISSMLLALMNTGCATVRGWFGKEEKVAAAVEPVETATKFSETPNYLATSQRQYRKMTRSRMEEEAELHSQAGSMWVMEGQGAYLFAQNKSRREGDALNVKVEGPAQKQIETKVSVIKKLLKQLEDEQQKQADQEKVQMASAEGTNNTIRAPAAEPKKDEKEKDEPLNLDLVPTRIVERLPDGNYRVKGQQPFMIGKREYKVIVTGLVRPEDFNDEGLSSNKLVDSQFDVVSIRRKTGEVTQ